MIVFGCSLLNAKRFLCFFPFANIFSFMNSVFIVMVRIHILSILPNFANRRKIDGEVYGWVNVHVKERKERKSIWYINQSKCLTMKSNLRQKIALILWNKWAKFTFVLLLSGFLFSGGGGGRRFDKSSFIYCIFEVGGSSWTDKTIPDESINFICDAYILTSMAIKSQAIVRNVQNVAERIAQPTINRIFHLLACKCSFIQSTFSRCVCVNIHISFLLQICVRDFFF